MTVLKTERLVLRPWRKEDAEALTPLADNRKIWLNVRDLFPHPYTPEDAQRWITASQANPLHHNFAIAKDDQLIGGIGLHLLTDVHRRVAEIGYWIGEPFWGQGFCTEAVKKVVEWAFDTFDIVRIQAGIFEHNGASMRVLEKAGFHQEAHLKQVLTKDGKTFDEFLYVRFTNRSLMNKT
jgi:RimJ/RimL family protein N-acetyltransferase